MKLHRAPALLFGVLFLAAAAQQAAGEEPARDFLQALRDKGYYDVALDYLDSLQGNMLVPPSFREVAQYEKGVTLLDASRLQRDMQLRERQLDEAQAAFREFVETRQTHPLAFSAKKEMAKLIVERAHILVSRTESAPAAQKQELLEQSRGMYKEAAGLFDQVREEIRVKLEAIPKVIPPAAAALKATRDNLRGEYVQTQLLGAAVLEEWADTFPEDSKEYKDKLVEAADKYKEVYEKYRTRLAGLYARLYQGRCLVKIKDYKNALSYFTDLLEQPDSAPEFRALKKQTLLLAVDILLDENDPKYVEAVKRLEPIVESLNPVEQQDPEWIRLQMALLKAYKFRKDALENDKPRPKEYDLSINKGRALVRVLMRTPSEFQEQARLLASEFNVRPISSLDEEPKTFADALAAGREQLGLMTSAPETVDRLKEQLKTEQDAQQKEELQQQLEEAEQQVQESPGLAMKYFRLALELTDDETPIADLNLAQYFLTYLYYARSDFLDAAVMGDFVARHYPRSAGARQCAKIALACYLKLYREAEDPAFETAQAIGICDYILKTWPQEEEAVDAINTLIALMLKEGRVEDAAAYVESIPADAPYRGMAELKTGQALWNKYLKEVAPAADTEDKAEQQAIRDAARPYKQQAEKTLAAGVARMRQAGAVDETFATALLSLAQIYVDTGQAEKGVALLEDPQVGPLTLVRAKNEAAQRENYDTATYITALRAYVSSLAAAQDADKVIEKAKGVMAELKAAMGSDADGDKKLVGVYVQLASQLEDQIKNADAGTKGQLSKGFETFLQQVRGEAKEFNVLNMAAEAFLSLGAGQDAGGAKQLSPDARRYYEEAADTFDKILDKAKGDPQWMPAEMGGQVRFRLADVRRRLGEYQQALAMFKEILNENNMTVNVQVKAAYAYQDWAAVLEQGGAAGKRTLYERAMKGSYPEGPKQQNVIWGWGKIAQTTQRFPNFRDTFHEARYNLAYCRFQYGRQMDTDDKKQKYIGMALSDIEMTWRLYPELGGQEWYKKYDALAKDIQRELGEQPQGIAAFQKIETVKASN